MSATAILRILASSPRAADPRASANIMTYSPRTHAICMMRCQYIMLALWSVPYIIYWHSGTFELVGYHATNKTYITLCDIYNFIFFTLQHHFTHFLAVKKIEFDMDAQKVFVQSSLSGDELLAVIKKTGRECSYVGLKK